MQRADRVAGLALTLLASLVALVPLSMGAQLAGAGAGLVDLAFLARAPAEAGRSGGIGPVLLSTMWVLGVCMAIVLPVGVGAALFLSEGVEAEGRTGRALQCALDVLGGVPSIVFGLFGNRLFCVELGLGYSILSGGLTLACMVLPLFVRAAEQALRACPVAYRRAGTALGVSRVGYLRHVLLPWAAPGLAVGLVLAAGRALAETAVLLFTAGYVTRWPESWRDSGRTLAVHIYDLAMNVTGASGPAAASALVLLAVSLGVAGMAHGLAYHLNRGGR